MNTQAVLKYQKISAQKCRLVANEVRGLPVNKAFEFLNYSHKNASQLILKVLESAVAHAEHNNSSDLDELFVKNVLVDEGPYGKRHRPRARGRVNQILKLPLSPLHKRKGKRRFSPWVTFFRPAFIIQACFSEEMEKCELDFLRNLDLFSVVRNLLVPFTACPANVTDSQALQCQHNYPAYSLFRL